MVPNNCIVENRTVPVSDDTYYSDDCKYRVAAQSHTAIRDMLNDTSFGLVANLTSEQRVRRGDKWSLTWNERNLFTITLNDTINTNEATKPSLVVAMWDNMAAASTLNMRLAHVLM